jgi:hypothetical protein
VLDVQGNEEVGICGQVLACPYVPTSCVALMWMTKSIDRLKPRPYIPCNPIFVVGVGRDGLYPKPLADLELAWQQITHQNAEESDLGVLLISISPQT